MMMFDQLDDLQAEEEVARAQVEAEALKIAFGTKPPKPLRPVAQDNLFDPNPQVRLRF